MLVLSFVALGALWPTPRFAARAAGGRPRPAFPGSSWGRFGSQPRSCRWGSSCSSSRPRSPAVRIRSRTSLRPGLCRLLAGSPAPLRAARQRVDRTEPLARSGRRIRLVLGAEWARGAAARGLPGAPGAVSGRTRPVRVHGARALLLRPVEPAGARVCDRLVLVPRPVRHGGLRPVGVVCAGEGFAILFTYLARMAPVASEGGRIRLRLPFTGLR